MSIATVHYLSMNLDKGYITGDFEVTEDIDTPYVFNSLRPGVEYIVDWGDEESDTGTAAADGTLELSHTFASPGTYQIQLVNGDKVVASATVTVVIAIDTD